MWPSPAQTMGMADLPPLLLLDGKAALDLAPRLMAFIALSVAIR